MLWFIQSQAIGVEFSIDIYSWNEMMLFHDGCISRFHTNNFDCRSMHFRDFHSAAELDELHLNLTETNKKANCGCMHNVVLTYSIYLGNSSAKSSTFTQKILEFIFFRTFYTVTSNQICTFDCKQRNAKFNVWYWRSLWKQRTHKF